MHAPTTHAIRTLAIALGIASPATTIAQDGERDDWFGGGGHRAIDATSPIGAASAERAVHVSRAANGRIVTVLEAQSTAGARTVIVTLTSDGADESDAVVLPIAFDAPITRPIAAAMRDVTGALLVVGNTLLPDGRFDPAIARVLPVGFVPDAAYGNDGVARPFAGLGDAQVLAATVDADGSVIACGDHRVGTASTRRAYCVRVLASGALDPSFGTTQRFEWLHADALDARVTAVARDAAGRLLIAGATQGMDGLTRTFTARLDANGAFDPTYCPAGCDLAHATDVGFRIEADASPHAGMCHRIAERSDGVIVVARFPGTGFGEVAYTRQSATGFPLGRVAWTPGDHTVGCGDLVVAADRTALVGYTWRDGTAQYGAVARMPVTPGDLAVFDPAFAASARLLVHPAGPGVPAINECGTLFVEPDGVICAGLAATAATPYGIDAALVRLRLGPAP